MIRTTSRFLLLLVVLVAISLTGCSRFYISEAAAKGHGCVVGSTRPESPIVCIDDTGSALSVHPETVNTWDRDPDGSGNPMVILFRTKSGKRDFKIVQRSGNCIEPELYCPPDIGLCRAKVVKRVEGAEAQETCKYDVVMAGFKDLDPTIRVGTCCG